MVTDVEGWSGLLSVTEVLDDALVDVVARMSEVCVRIPVNCEAIEGVSVGAVLVELLTVDSEVNESEAVLLMMLDGKLIRGTDEELEEALVDVEALPDAVDVAFDDTPEVEVDTPDSTLDSPLVKAVDDPKSVAEVFADEVEPEAADVIVPDTLVVAPEEVSVADVNTDVPVDAPETDDAPPDTDDVMLPDEAVLVSVPEMMEDRIDDSGPVGKPEMPVNVALDAEPELGTAESDGDELGKIDVGRIGGIENENGFEDVAEAESDAEVGVPLDESVAGLEDASVAVDENTPVGVLDTPAALVIADAALVAAEAASDVTEDTIEPTPDVTWPTPEVATLTIELRSDVALPTTEVKPPIILESGLEGGVVVAAGAEESVGADDAAPMGDDEGVPLTEAAETELPVGVELSVSDGATALSVEEGPKPRSEVTLPTTEVKPPTMLESGLEGGVVVAAGAEESVGEDDATSVAVGDEGVALDEATEAELSVGAALSVGDDDVAALSVEEGPKPRSEVMPTTEVRPPTMLERGFDGGAVVAAGAEESVGVPLGEDAEAELPAGVELSKGDEDAAELSVEGAALSVEEALEAPSVTVGDDAAAPLSVEDGVFAGGVDVKSPTAEVRPPARDVTPFPRPLPMEDRPLPMPPRRPPGGVVVAEAAALSVVAAELEVADEVAPSEDIDGSDELEGDAESVALALELAEPEGVTDAEPVLDVDAESVLDADAESVLDAAAESELDAVAESEPVGVASGDVADRDAEVELAGTNAVVPGKRPSKPLSKPSPKPVNP